MTNFEKRRRNNETFIIAELSANHGNSLDIALETVRAAAACGADAIKLQTFTPDTITLDCDNSYFQINHGTLWDGTTLYKLYKNAFLPWEWHKPIQKLAFDLGLDFFSTPFDPSSVDFLESLDVPIYKIASPEITDIPLITLVASKNKPMLISTGMASIADIEEAIWACRNSGNHDITLLKCTSSYPAPYEEANLLTMVNYASTFNVKIGLSDHTLGHAVAVGAVALGAKVIEKHFVLNRDVPSPDSSFSLLPDEFKILVESIRIVEKAVGKVTYELGEKAKKNKDFCRSLFIAKDIKEGEIFTMENLRSVRPGAGVSPKFLYSILGKKSRISLEKGTPMKLEYLEL